MTVFVLKKTGRFNDMIATIDNTHKINMHLFKNGKRFVQQILVIQQVCLLLTVRMSVTLMLILIKLVLKIRGKINCINGNSCCELAEECGSKPSIIVRNEFASLSRKISRLIQYASSGIAHYYHFYH